MQLLLLLLILLSVLLIKHRVRSVPSNEKALEMKAKYAKKRVGAKRKVCSCAINVILVCLHSEMKKSDTLNAFRGHGSPDGWSTKLRVCLSRKDSSFW